MESKESLFLFVFSGIHDEWRNVNVRLNRIIWNSRSCCTKGYLIHRNGKSQPFLCLSIENYAIETQERRKPMKGAYVMRGDAVRHAMEHAEPELAKAIWKDLMSPKPSKDEHRRQLVAELEQRVLKARRDAQTV